VKKIATVAKASKTVLAIARLLLLYSTDKEGVLIF
jgi:hypothetical protein